MKRKYIALSLILFGLLLFGCVNNNVSSKTATTSEIKMRVQDGYIQYYTGSDWNNVIAVEELKGEKGEKGDKGDTGDSGINGKNGVDGINGIDGKDGTNGVNGKDAKNQNYITKKFYVSVSLTNAYLDTNKNYPSLIITNQDKTENFYKQYYATDSSKLLGYYFYMNEDGIFEIEARTEEGWEFVEWSDGVTETKRTITYNDDEYITAQFKYSKTELTEPTITSYEVDYKTKDLIVNWKEVENAKDYTVKFNDKEYTCTTNVLKVNASGIDMKEGYYIAITANPIDSSKYIASKYTDTLFELNLMYTNLVPEYESNTKLNDYLNTLKEAGFGLEDSQGKINITYITEGATQENDNVVISVNPEPNTKLYTMIEDINISIYHYNHD